MVYAIEALDSASRVLGADVSAAAEQALWFIEAQARTSGADLYWALDFHGRSGPENLGATAVLLPSVATLGRILDVDVSRLVHGARMYLRSHWTPAPGTPFLVSFRVPTWGGLAADRFTWELPLDPLVVSALVQTSPEVELLHHERHQIGVAVAQFLNDRDPRGFWVDLLKSQEGSLQGMTGNSDFYQSALLDYLDYQGLAFTSFLP